MNTSILANAIFLVTWSLQVLASDQWALQALDSVLGTDLESVGQIQFLLPDSNSSLNYMRRVLKCTKPEVARELLILSRNSSDPNASVKFLAEIISTLVEKSGWSFERGSLSTEIIRACLAELSYYKWNFFTAFPQFHPNPPEFGYLHKNVFGLFTKEQHTILQRYFSEEWSKFATSTTKACSKFVSSISKYETYHIINLLKYGNVQPDDLRQFFKHGLGKEKTPKYCSWISHFLGMKRYDLAEVALECGSKLTRSDEVSYCYDYMDAERLAHDIALKRTAKKAMLLLHGGSEELKPVSREVLQKDFVFGLYEVEFEQVLDDMFYKYTR